MAFAQTTTSLSVQCNQGGAGVYLNDSLIGYTSPNFSALVFPEDYSSTVRLSDRYQLHATLAPKPRLVDYEIKIPEYFVAKQGKSGKFSDFEIYLDGKRLQSAFGKTSPGIHMLTLVVSRELSLENNFELVQGRSASIELFLGISVR